MTRILRRLLLVWAAMLSSGVVLYYIGSRLGAEQPARDAELLFRQSAADTWLYAGGLLMLLSCSVIVAAIKLWAQSRQKQGVCSLTGDRRG